MSLIVRNEVNIASPIGLFRLRKNQFLPLTKFCIFIRQFHRLGRVLHLPFTQAIAASYPLQITLQHDPDKVHEPANLLPSTKRVPRPHCHPPSSLPPALELRAPISHRSGKVGEPTYMYCFPSCKHSRPNLPLLAYSWFLKLCPSGQTLGCPLVLSSSVGMRASGESLEDVAVSFDYILHGQGGGNLAQGCSTTSRVVHG